MDVWEYFQTREREIKDCSLHIPKRVSLFSAEESDQRGMVYGPVAHLELAGAAPTWATVRAVVRALGVTFAELGAAIDAGDR